VIQEGFEPPASFWLEREGGDRPVWVAELLLRFVEDS
jgi:hypothetical protein